MVWTVAPEGFVPSIDPPKPPLHPVEAGFEGAVASAALPCWVAGVACEAAGGQSVVPFCAVLVAASCVCAGPDGVEGVCAKPGRAGAVARAAIRARRRMGELRLWCLLHARQRREHDQAAIS